MKLSSLVRLVLVLAFFSVLGFAQTAQSNLPSIPVVLVQPVDHADALELKALSQSWPLDNSIDARMANFFAQKGFVLTENGRQLTFIQHYWTVRLGGAVQVLDDALCTKIVKYWSDRWTAKQRSNGALPANWDHQYFGGIVPVWACTTENPYSDGFKQYEYEQWVKPVTREILVTRKGLIKDFRIVPEAVWRARGNLPYSGRDRPRELYLNARGAATAGLSGQQVRAGYSQLTALLVRAGEFNLLSSSDGTCLVDDQNARWDGCQWVQDYRLDEDGWMPWRGEDDKQTPVCYFSDLEPDGFGSGVLCVYNKGTTLEPLPLLARLCGPSALDKGDRRFGLSKQLGDTLLVRARSASTDMARKDQKGKVSRPKHLVKREWEEDTLHHSALGKLAGVMVVSLDDTVEIKGSSYRLVKPSAVTDKVMVDMVCKLGAEVGLSDPRNGMGEEPPIAQGSQGQGIPTGLVVDDHTIVDANPGDPLGADEQKTLAGHLDPNLGTGGHGAVGNDPPAEPNPVTEWVKEHLWWLVAGLLLAVIVLAFFMGAPRSDDMRSPEYGQRPEASGAPAMDDARPPSGPGIGSLLAGLLSPVWRIGAGLVRILGWFNPRRWFRRRVAAATP